MRAPGNPQVARENVDLLFPNGLEVERDIPTAIYWLNRAADSGKAEALAAWTISVGKVAAASGTTKKRTV